MKKINKRKLETVVIIVILLILAIIVGLNRIKVSDFNPINGDFQNYNPIRRFLNGQIPYKDFAVYLGTGHLLILSLVQLIVGNNFTSSLFVTNMVTMICFQLTVFSVSFLILKDKKKALYITLFMTLINIIRPYITSFLNPEFIAALDFGIKPGNSARLIRIVIAPIVILLICIGFKFLDKTTNKRLSKNRELMKKIYVAMIAGGTILWSNDGGIATYISISFIYFLLLIKKYKKDIKQIIKYTMMYIVISIASFLLLTAIITRGNILSWFEFNIGVSSYQKWYYGEAIEKQNISLIDFDVSLNNIICIVIAIYYIYKIFKEKEKKNIFEYASLSFILTASILSTYLYQFLSGGISRNIIYLLLLILMVSYIVKFFSKMKQEYVVNNIVKSGIVIVSIGVIITSIGVKIQDRKHKDSSNIYIEELGGYFTELGESINYATERIGKEKVFSTYASAIEAATKQFQPSGIDYIIHCLGDKQREKYIEDFNKKEFQYVSVVDKNTYAMWIRNANWFFYKELYKNYKPVFTTEYNTFYEESEEERNINDINEMKVEEIKQDDSTYKIKITLQDKNYNGMVDLKLSYNTKFKRNFFKTLDINRYVYVKDITTQKISDCPHINYNIPNKSDEYYIPITIIEGEGEVEISSYPINNSELQINTVEVIDSFDVMYKYCYANKEKISQNKIYVDNNKENKVILKNAKAIKIEDKQANIVNSKDIDSYIELELDCDASDFAYPNFFEVIK